MAKDTPNTLDIKSLPRWQKYTIIAFVLVLAATFLISGAMIALVEFWAQGETPNGEIGEEPVSAQHFRSRYTALSHLITRPDLVERLFPEVAFFDPKHNALRPDPDHMFLGQPVRLPDAVHARLLSEPRAPRSESEIRGELLGRLTWLHILLAHEAAAAGVTVPAATANALAKDAALQIFDETIDIGEDPQEAERRRDARYRRLVRERLYLKRYVDSQTAGAVSVSLDEAVDAFHAANRKSVAEYLRVPVFNTQSVATVAYAGELPARLPEPYRSRFTLDGEAGELTYHDRIDSRTRRHLLSASSDPAWQAAVRRLADELSPFHPEVDNRAREALAAERNAARARRAIAQTTGVSAGALFPDPVEAFAYDRMRRGTGEAGGTNFRESRFELAILPVEFDDLKDQVSIDLDTVRRFREHEPYREAFLRTERSDKEIEDELAGLDTDALAELVVRGMDALAGVDGPAWHGGDEEVDRLDGDVAILSGELKAPLRDALRYLPEAEAGERIREYLRDDAARAEALRRMRADIYGQIQSRQQLNDDVTGHANRMAQVRYEQARTYEELYWGGREHRPQGLLNGVRGLERDLHNALRSLRESAGLDNGPTASASNGRLDAPLSLGGYREALAALVESLNEQAIPAFVYATRMRDERDTTDANDPLSLERELASVQQRLDRVARTSGQSTQEQMRSREIEQTIQRWLQRRLDGLRAFHARFGDAIEQLRDALNRELELAYSLGERDVPRILLEERLLLLEERLLGTIRRAASDIDVEATALGARSQAVAAFSAYEPFRPDRYARPVGRHVPGAIDILRALPPTSFGVEPIIVRNEATYRGRLYNGLPGAGIPPLRITWGLTIDEIEQSSMLRERLPYFRSARQWNLDADTAGAESLSSVLRNLRPRTYSQPLGVEGVGYYIVALLQRDDPPAPSFAEVEEWAIEEYLDRSTPDLRVEAAKELAEIVRDRLVERTQAVTGMTAATLAEQLAQVAPQLADTTAATPYWPQGQPYTREAIDELVRLLRGESVELVTQTQLAAPTPNAQTRRAMAEARALLTQHAMNAVAERYRLPLERPAPFGKADRVPDMWLVTEALLWRRTVRLAPYFDFDAPLQERFPAPGEREIDRRDNRRVAYVVTRSLGSIEASDESRDLTVLDLASMDVEALEAARERLRVQRIHDTPMLQRFTDLGSMLRYFEEELNLPVRIRSHQMQGRGGR